MATNLVLNLGDVPIDVQPGDTYDVLRLEPIIAVEGADKVLEALRFVTNGVTIVASLAKLKTLLDAGANVYAIRCSINGTKLFDIKLVP